MAGIYIHIPFCASRCIYCGFYSTTGLQLRQQYVDALCQEVKARSAANTISTIYLGGGTPSQLTPSQLRQIFDCLYKYNKVEPGAEVTIEVNPDDVSPEFADVIRKLPINRVSMGAQTFDNSRLRFLHRRHSASQVSDAVSRLRDAGIKNLSIDLMYGFPSRNLSPGIGLQEGVALSGQSLTDWEHDIDAVLTLAPEHISAYCLSIEPGTPLARLCQVNENPAARRAMPSLSFPDEETERAMYEHLIDRITAAGYEHYEISNFARPGYRSRHNSAYWDGSPYIGLGAAAHSFDGQACRSWNVADIHQYIDGIKSGCPNRSEEHLSDDEQYNDRVATALRTREGLPLGDLSPRHFAHCLAEARPFIDSGLLQITHSPSHSLTLTRQGLFVSDMIMSALMRV